ncbi:DUF1622 domain-containing protein [Parvularcula dongshanensis]|uniref:Putative membrane protein n=1 Tax=Parvularcula dongshanensis TaxID=1173995 RepID=A0A840I6U4_9PROT|nr:DUF1622 domain-containing protein [Parvularcula dongshanensis]MBB4659838.1 putative membrane protein [Parvularcula dongshanensis]
MSWLQELGGRADVTTAARAAEAAEAGGVRAVVETLIEQASFVVEFVAAVILLIGAARFLLIVVTMGLSRREHLSRALQAARLRLGAYILAGLEFLIVADILFTIVNRTLQDLVALAIVASVRTLISYFLGRELAELRESDRPGAAETAKSMSPSAE